MHAEGGNQVHYFAYGSNLNLDQMRERCSAAEFLCRARLNDYRLVFPRKSIRRRCGVAGIVPLPGQAVWGVVYNLPDCDLSHLDAQEGYNANRSRAENAYMRVQVIVEQEGDDSVPLPVQTYIAVPQSNPPLPNRDYMQLIIGGAKFWSLPPEYIVTLEQQETSD
jgi:gamma-glutamylcyclotransferase (GGCT)/AIG2-like uncharacterized protein YtfP